MNASRRLTTVVVLASILSSAAANPLKHQYYSHLISRQDSVDGCFADDQCSCEGLGALCNLDMSWALDPALNSVLNGTTSTTTSAPIPTSTTISPTTTTVIQQPPQTTTAQSENLCVGNQVEGNCKAGTLPDEPPFSGPQAPSCLKADGSPGAPARLNQQKLVDTATEYCNNLVNGKVVLSDSTTNPKPGLVPGAAEGGKTMVLVTMYYSTSCPKDKSSSTLDFSSYGVQKCVEAFSGFMTTVCSQDKTWTNYNADFTVMGGVLGTDCGLFSVYSQ